MDKRDNKGGCGQVKWKKEAERELIQMKHMYEYETIGEEGKGKKKQMKKMHEWSI